MLNYQRVIHQQMFAQGHHLVAWVNDQDLTTGHWHDGNCDGGITPAW